MYETVTIATGLGDSLTDITDQVRAVVKERAVKSGVCLVVVPHTTAAITINSGMDPATVQDVVEDVRRLVPTRTDFHHIVDTPSDAAAHIKASLIGNTETVLIEDGDLVLRSLPVAALLRFRRPATTAGDGQDHRGMTSIERGQVGCKKTVRRHERRRRGRPPDDNGCVKGGDSP